MQSAVVANGHRLHFCKREPCSVQKTLLQPVIKIQRKNINCRFVVPRVIKNEYGFSSFDVLLNPNASKDGEIVKPSLKKILVANRGEIAVRIIRAGNELGLRTVAIYSPADRLQPHRFKADESYQVGNASMKPVDCYLDIEGILQIAKENGVDAIHPGYGFLAENATFSRRCEEEGITFVGPDASVIGNMGDKTAARRLATKANVPIVPGLNNAVESYLEVSDFAKNAGYPLMIKAAMGGGGRGMRVVRFEEELSDAYQRASNEAKASFGDGRLFVEKFIEEPRHIEVQVLADTFGNVVHLYERDCSIQRRHQKIVEIAPAYALAQEVKDKLHAAAVTIAKEVCYCNAGTVEFMVDKNGDYYFLEVNPRIQVEHTVTEEVTGVDLVQAQILIAGGCSLADIGLASQADITEPNGFAIQCRVTSEDPETNFQPDTGRLEVFRVPGGPGVRLDGAVTTGNYISQYYDSLLSKVITWGPSYEKSILRMRRALREFNVRGIKTNLPFLENVFERPEFWKGETTTKFIEQHSAELFDLSLSNQLGSSKLLDYLGDMVVNGPNHKGATGPSPEKVVPVLPVVPKEAAEDGGWRQVLKDKGPRGFAKQIREHKGLLLTDTTWRDAHQSLLATRMRTIDMDRIAPATSHILRNAASLEMWGGATFDVAMRFLHESPWERLERLREQVPNVPFQMLLRGANAVGYTAYPDNVVRAFTSEAKKCGIDIFRVFDSLNYVDNLKFGMDAVAATGGVVEGTICYTGDVSDPNKEKYKLDYYMDLTEQLVDHGIDILGVKDMAGLLKPRAATQLIGALRERWPELTLHLHTHDTAGTGVATYLAACEAGADIVDVCIDTMSGMTAQPSMGAVVHALKGTDYDTGIQPDELQPLTTYWEQVRQLYSPFESTLRAGNAEVYSHEMPGGQYTNLKFQSQQLGLKDQWDKVKGAYAQANIALGDVVKVTPSSKVVGDLAQCMVQNDIVSANDLLEKADTLSFPQSVIEFMQGYLGQPPNGWPEPLRSKILKDKPVYTGRPGEKLPPLNLYALEANLQAQYNQVSVDIKDVLSSALYPKVFEEYQSTLFKYGPLLTKLPTRSFLEPLEEDEEIEVEVAKGNVISIKYKAKGELQPNGIREVFFETNGIPRVVEIEDRSSEAYMKRADREKADPTALGSVGAPMSGEVVEINVQPRSRVEAGTALVVMSAMKMETAVCAPCTGVVQHVAVDKGDVLTAGDLVVLIDEGEALKEGAK